MPAASAKTPKPTAEAGAPGTKTKITRAMIKAGAAELARFNLDYESEESAVKRIYEAMDDGQRRDKLLLRLLKAPPQPRPKRVRDKEKPTHTRAKRKPNAATR